MNTEVGYQPKMRYEVLLKRNSITWVTLDWAHGYCADEAFWLFLRAVLHSLIWLPFLLNRQAFHHMRQIINLEVTVLSEQFSTLQFIILCFHCRYDASISEVPCIHPVPQCTPRFLPRIWGIFLKNSFQFGQFYLTTFNRELMNWRLLRDDALGLCERLTAHAYLGTCRRRAKVDAVVDNDSLAS